MALHGAVANEALTLPAPDEIHVWQARLDDPTLEVSLFYETLTEDERDRAARFSLEKHRQRFIVGRGIWRNIIARYLAVEPAEVRFDYAARGKPSLAEPKIENFRSNVSHSRDLALYAFALGVPLGVDVEIIRPVNNMDAIAKRFFSPLEYDLLQQVSPGDGLEAFFNCWTRKEAFIKANGQGLSMPLDSFAVSVAASEPARFLHLKSDSCDSDAWSLHHLKPAADSVGAVAIPAVDRKVRLRPFL